MARLEHANITVGDAARTAAWLERVFGWTIRWQGSAMNGDGQTIHIGTDEEYLALYQPKMTCSGRKPDYEARGQLNHIGIVVADLNMAEKAVRAEGYEPHSHQKYEPGERFYFFDENDVEYEIVAYD
ncbi:MAG: VOC family protein [Planktotalea sp.]|uniref:VOC family protein n=1 Tax=Planktotalea sp. TaxID=2029877 RepID=UPI003C77267C